MKQFFNLTTTEMLNALRKNNYATNQFGLNVGYAESGALIMWNENEPKPNEEQSNRYDSLFIIRNEELQTHRWTVHKDFVTYQEAFDAFLNEGKDIMLIIGDYEGEKDEPLLYEFKQDSESKDDIFKTLHYDSITFKELLTSKWIIL